MALPELRSTESWFCGRGLKLKMAKQTVETADEFFGCMEQKLRGGVVALGVALGMQTGLFDVMIELGEEPKTSAEIALAGNFKERYVREWLACMASAGVVCIDTKGERFWFPAHRSNIMQLKGLALMTPILAGGFHQIVECFKKNGPSGVPYEQYPKFDQLMSLMQGPFFHDKLVQKMIPSIPELHQKLAAGIHVLDVGCGVGLSTKNLAAHFPKSKFCEIDSSEPAIAEAQNTTAATGLTNAEFVLGDITKMPAEWDTKFDYLFTSVVIHDLPYPEKALEELYRVLKHGGMLSIVETVGHRNVADNLAKYKNPDVVNLKYTFTVYHCIPTSLVKENGAGTGVFWGREEALRMLEKCKFQVLSITEATADLMHLLCRKH